MDGYGVLATRSMGENKFGRRGAFMQNIETVMVTDKRDTGGE